MRLEVMPRLEHELDTVRADLADERQARTAAEQAAAVAIAEHKASERRAIELQERAERAEKMAHELQQDAKALSTDNKATAKELTRVTGELATTRERLATLTTNLDAAQALIITAAPATKTKAAPAKKS
ncbi:MAG: hypothetical protein Q8O52_17080 [Sulfuritalea sp.]|nr:hypothetical protein [Sulfuritalea sp.]